MIVAYEYNEKYRDWKHDSINNEKIFLDIMECHKRLYPYSDVVVIGHRCIYEETRPEKYGGRIILDVWCGQNNSAQSINDLIKRRYNFKDTDYISDSNYKKSRYYIKSGRFIFLLNRAKTAVDKQYRSIENIDWHMYVVTKMNGYKNMLSRDNGNEVLSDDYASISNKVGTHDTIVCTRIDNSKTLLYNHGDDHNPSWKEINSEKYVEFKSNMDTVTCFILNNNNTYFIAKKGDGLFYAVSSKSGKEVRMPGALDINVDDEKAFAFDLLGEDGLWRAYSEKGKPIEYIPPHKSIYACNVFSLVELSDSSYVLIDGDGDVVKRFKEKPEINRIHMDDKGIRIHFDNKRYVIYMDGHVEERNDLQANKYELGSFGNRKEYDKLK